MYKVLYRAYRPEVFSQVLGQQHIVKILQNQIASDSVNHAYLFCGTRGTGKTTMARLLAKGVNCLSEEEKPCGECENCKAVKQGTFMDLVEIDAASNRGVESIRELRENANYAPVNGKKKVYIIDEVHMLTTEAFNALLKTLEEPPENVMFILCTTEPEKLPTTVLSRCMRMDFRRVSEPILKDAFRRICEDRNVEIEDDALRLIVTNADGSVRDGLTILDQCIAGRSDVVTRKDVLDSLGAVGEDAYIKLTDCVVNHNPARGLQLIAQLVEDGKDTRQIIQGWISHYRNLLMTKYIEHPEDMLNMSVENVEKVREQSSDVQLEDINTAIIEIARTLIDSKTTSQPRILLEVCFVKLATMTKDGSVVLPTQGKPIENIKKDIPQVQNSAPAYENHAQRQPDANQMTVAQRVEASQEDIQNKSIENQSSENHSLESQADTASQRKQEPEYTVQISDAGDISQIWEAVLEDGENQRGDFGIVRIGASPVKMNDKEFVVFAKGLSEIFIEKNREFISQLISKYAGGQRILILSTEEPKEEEKADPNDIAEKVISKFGVTKVDIE